MDTWKSEELVKEFYRSQRGGGAKAASSRDKLRFFLHAYLMEEWPRDLDRVNSDIIRDFLGSWFLRHVGGAKADLRNFLEVFHQFFSFLYHSGRLSEPEYEDLEMVCADADYFMERFDDFFNPMPGSWEEYALGAIPEGSDPLAGEYHAAIDRQVWMLATNLGKDEAPAILDFALFLDYVASRPLRLRRDGCLPLRHQRRINARFSTPEDLDVVAEEDAPRRLPWFMLMAETLELSTVNEKSELTIQPRAEAFLDLSADTQLAVIIDATWRRIPWAELGAKDLRRVSAWAQKHRDGFAVLLSGLTPCHEWPLDPDSENDRNDTLLARYVYFHEVVERNVLFNLHEIGILNYQRWDQGAGKALDVKSIATTRFGKLLMKLYAKRALRGSKAEETPLARLTQSLLSY